MPLFNGWFYKRRGKIEKRAEKYRNGTGKKGEWEEEQETKTRTSSDYLSSFALHLLFSMNLAQQKVMFFLRWWLLQGTAAQDRFLRFYTQ